MRTFLFGFLFLLLAFGLTLLDTAFAMLAVRHGFISPLEAIGAIGTIVIFNGIAGYAAYICLRIACERYDCPSRNSRVRYRHEI